MTQAQALDILKTGANVFLTGEPGSGKTHTINEYVAYLRKHDIEPAITASTGIAATHLGGMTIHSWSGIGVRNKLDKYDIDKIANTEYVVRRMRKTRVLIIDEVSMLSPEMLSMVDLVCREVKQNPDAFGGMQIVFVGDFFQLPPVVRQQQSNRDPEDQSLFDSDEEGTRRFAYGSPAWKAAGPMICYLSEQHRQEDGDLLDVLGAIRSNTFGEDHQERIASRKTVLADVPSGAPRLFSHNADVDGFNDRMLKGIVDEKEHVFEMQSQGFEALTMTLKKGCLSPERLVLKEGAEVMFTKNSPKEGFVNGTLGTVIEFDEASGYPVVEMRNGEYITVTPAEWVMEEAGKIRAMITQIPLRLAWAITVHKSQGMSMDAAVMDLSQVFEYGQGYVALSRVRSLEGLFISGWNDRAFEVDPQLLEDDGDFRSLSHDAVNSFGRLAPEDLKKMHNNFITACGGSIEENIFSDGKARSPKAVKTDTKLLTLSMWNEGKTIDEISEARGLKDQTIYTHIEDLYKSQALSKESLKKILTPKLEKALPKIHQVFIDIDTRSLGPVHEHFKGQYTYDDLRIARMFLD